MDNVVQKVKEMFKGNKVEIIMGSCIVIPMLLATIIFSGVDSIMIAILVVPILYRLIANAVLKIMSWRGIEKNIFIFNTTSRIAIFIAFLIVYIYGMVSGQVSMVVKFIGMKKEIT